MNAAGWCRDTDVAHYVTNPRVSTVAACGEDLGSLDPDIDGLGKCPRCSERLGAAPE